MFILETVQTSGIAQLSYFLADTETRQAVVIDPRTDVDVYLKLARKHKVGICEVLETHIHADFVCGSRELRQRIPELVVRVSGVDDDYDFPAASISDGERFRFGEFELTARHTPGHTPEHMAFELTMSEQPDALIGVFTGDSLFVGSAGRPDLMGDSQTDQLTKKLYETLYQYYLKLDDHVLIYPGHGAGSACGAGISDRLSSTIGFERRHNPFLRHKDYESFYDHVVVDAPHAPSHYSRLKKLNAGSRELVPHLPPVVAMNPEDFRRASREANVIIIDTRQMLAFAGGHIAGAINLGNRPEISVWTGEMFDGDESFLLVAEADTDIPEIQRRMIRTGNFRFRGFLAGGMEAWEDSGFDMETMPIMTVHQLQANLSGRRPFKLLDVRSDEEYESGRIPSASHYFVADMRKRIDGLDKTQPHVVYCASGYRASIAASLMKARGFQHVQNVPGSWKAWVAIGGDVEQPDAEQPVGAGSANGKG